MDSNRELPETQEIDDLKSLVQKQQQTIEDLQTSTQDQFSAIMMLLKNLSSASAKTCSSASVESSSIQDVKEISPAEVLPQAPTNVGDTEIQRKTSSSALAESSGLPEIQNTQAEVLPPASADVGSTKTKTINQNVKTSSSANVESSSLSETQIQLSRSSMAKVNESTLQVENQFTTDQSKLTVPTSKASVKNVVEHASGQRSAGSQQQPFSWDLNSQPNHEAVPTASVKDNPFTKMPFSGIQKPSDADPPPPLTPRTPTPTPTTPPTPTPTTPPTPRTNTKNEHSVATQKQSEDSDPTIASPKQTLYSQRSTNPTQYRPANSVRDNTTLDQQQASKKFTILCTLVANCIDPQALHLVLETKCFRSDELVFKALLHTLQSKIVLVENAQFWLVCTGLGLYFVVNTVFALGKR